MADVEPAGLQALPHSSDDHFVDPACTDHLGLQALQNSSYDHLHSVTVVSETKPKRNGRGGSRQHCSAVNCTNNRSNCVGISFFRFPKDPVRWVTLTVF